MARNRDPEKMIAVAHRDARIVELRRANWAWADIANEVGLCMSRCHQIFEKYRRDIPNSVAEAYRTEELDLLGRGIADLLTLVSNPEVSPRTKAELHREIRQHSESRRKLLGLDAPAKREIEVFDASAAEARERRELDELVREVAAADALKEMDR